MPSRKLTGSAGEVLRVLREEDADRNTLVIFTSDNGRKGISRTVPDGKVTTWREAYANLASRGGGESAGRRRHAGVRSTMDLFPTFVKLAGLEMRRIACLTAKISPRCCSAMRRPGTAVLLLQRRGGVGGAKRPLEAPRGCQQQKDAAATGRRRPRRCYSDVQQDISERRNLAGAAPKW